MSNDQQPQRNASPFGITTPANNNPSGGGFGAFASMKSPFAAATGNALGNPDSSTPAPPLFGSGAFGQNPQPGSGGGSIFGSGSSPFGGGQTGNVFGSNPTPSTQPNGGGGGGGGIFGSSTGGAQGLSSGIGGTQTGNTNALGSGGNAVATPNPAGSGPVAAAGTPAPALGGLFGSNKSNQAGVSGVTPSTNIFGGQAPLGLQSTASAGVLGTATPTPTPSNTGNPPFGGASKPLFGSSPLVPPSGGLFGGQSANQAGSTGATLSTNTSAVPAPTALGAPQAAGGASLPPTSIPLPSLFGSKKADATPASTTSPALGVLGAGKDAATKEDKSGAGTPSKDAAPVASLFAGFSQSKNAAAPKTPEPSATTAPASATAAAPTAVPAPSMLRGKTVEDIVNRWTTELDAHTREFSQFASEVAVWDRTLIENGNYISGLHASVIQTESTQTSLDQTLDHVEQQQRQLSATLDQYEKTAGEIFHGPGGVMTSTEGLGLADSERDKSYALAATLYTQLDDLSRSLTQMVDTVNGFNLSQIPSKSGADDTTVDDQISIIAGILNAHLSSLQWIDGSLKDMERKVKDAQRKLRDVESVRDTGVSGRGRSYGLGSARQ